MGRPTSFEHKRLLISVKHCIREQYGEENTKNIQTVVRLEIERLTDKVIVYLFGYFVHIVPVGGIITDEIVERYERLLGVEHKDRTDDFLFFLYDAFNALYRILDEEDNPTYAVQLEFFSMNDRFDLLTDLRTFDVFPEPPIAIKAKAGSSPAEQYAQRNGNFCDRYAKKEKWFDGSEFRDFNSYTRTDDLMKHYAAQCVHWPKN